MDWKVAGTKEKKVEFKKKIIIVVKCRQCYEVIFRLK